MVGIRERDGDTDQRAYSDIDTIFNGDDYSEHVNTFTHTIRFLADDTYCDSCRAATAGAYHRFYKR